MPDPARNPVQIPSQIQGDDWLQIPLAEGRRSIEAAQDGRLAPSGRAAPRPGARAVLAQRVAGALALGLLAAGFAILATFILLTLVFHFGPAA